MVERDNTRHHILDAVLGRYRHLGLPPLLTNLSFAEIAERGEMSVSTVYRAVRSKGRLNRLVLIDAATEHAESRSELHLLSAMQTGTVTGPAGSSVRLTVSAADSLNRRPDVFPQAVAWSYLNDHDVSAAQASWYRLLHHIILITGEPHLRDRNLRPKPPLTSSTYFAGAIGLVTGALGLAELCPGICNAEKVSQLAHQYLITSSESGFEIPEVEAMSQPPIPRRPMLNAAERQVVSAAQSCLLNGKLPGPFDHLSARVIASCASISIGTIYRSFDTIDTLRSALLRRKLSQIENLLTQESATGDSTDILKRYTSSGTDISILLLAATCPDAAAKTIAEQHIAWVLGLLKSQHTDASTPPIDVAICLLSLALGCHTLRTVVPDLIAAHHVTGPEDLLSIAARFVSL